MNTAVNELLLPINDEAPCGYNPRVDNSFSNPYYQLKNCRQRARLAERQRTQQGDVEILVAAEWREVESLATNILKTKAKDFEIASWLIEAWVRIYSFEGLVNSLHLLRGLVEIFSNELSQQSIEDLEQQLTMVQGLSGEQQPGSLIVPIVGQPITGAHGERNYATWQYQQAVEISQLSNEEVKSNRIKQAGFDLRQIQLAAKQSSSEFKSILTTAISDTLDALTQCDEQFVAVFQQLAPSWHFLRQTIISIQEAVNSLYPNSDTDTSANRTLPESQDSSTDSLKSSFQERETVLSAILEAADFFQKNEPHSPIIYLLQQAARWANLPLPELMKEVLSNPEHYYAYCKITGIPLEENNF